MTRRMKEMGTPADIAQNYLRSLDDAHRRQQIAMGAGRRIERGEMTVRDFDTKIDQLVKVRNGYEDRIADFQQDRDFLAETGFATLNAAVEKLAA